MSRAYVVGGEPRTVRVDLDPERLPAYHVSPLEVQQAIQGANIVLPAGDFTATTPSVRVKAGMVIDRPEQLSELVVGVFQDRPVFLKDVATVETARGSGELRAPWLGTGTGIRSGTGLHGHADRPGESSPSRPRHRRGGVRTRP